MNGRIDKGSFEVQTGGTPTPTPTPYPGEMYSNTASAPDASTETIGIGGLGFFEIALVLVRLDHGASVIVNTDHGIM